MFGKKFTVITRTRTGEKLFWPGVASSEPRIERRGDSNVQVIDMITMRQTLPDADGNVTTFWRETPESLAFTAPRFSTLPGIDVHEETGKQLSFEDLGERILKSAVERQDLFIAQREAETTLDADGLPL